MADRELSEFVGTGLTWEAIGETIDVVFGTGAGEVCEGNDSRLSDDRDPNAHATTHVPGGTDAIATASAVANPPGTASAEGNAVTLARSNHTHALAAFGSGAGTFCEGNDSRLSDSRAPNGAAGGDLGGTYPNPSVAKVTTTSGPTSLTVGAITDTQMLRRNGTSIEGVSAAAAGTIQPDDSADAGAASTWARSDHRHAIACAVAGTISPDDAAAEGVSTSFSRADHTHAITCAAASAVAVDGSNAEGSASSFARSDHTHVVLPKFTWFADQLDNPVTADWAVNSLAAASACTNNSGLTVRRFANAAENGVGCIFVIPAGVTNLVFSFVSRAETTPAGTVAVVPRVYVREFPDNAAVESWSAGTDLTALSFTTNELWQYDTQTVSLATLSLVAGRVVQLELTRRGSDGSDSLTVDWTLLSFSVGFT
jgi:hypothetical protein